LYSYFCNLNTQFTCRSCFYHITPDLHKATSTHTSSPQRERPRISYHLRHSESAKRTQHHTMAGESSKKTIAAGKAAIPLDIDGHNLPPSPAPSSPRNGRKYALMTELVYTESSDQYNASSVPIYQVCTTLAGKRTKSRNIEQERNECQTNHRSPQPSSKSPQQAAAANTTTHARATPHEHTSSATSQRS
jgi:hypothetical protein